VKGGSALSNETRGLAPDALLLGVRQRVLSSALSLHAVGLIRSRSRCLAPRRSAPRGLELVERGAQLGRRAHVIERESARPSLKERSVTNTAGWRGLETDPVALGALGLGVRRGR
jgi:hypothetical protein